MGRGGGWGGIGVDVWGPLGGGGGVGLRRGPCAGGRGWEERCGAGRGAGSPYRSEWGCDLERQGCLLTPGGSGGGGLVVVA